MVINVVLPLFDFRYNSRRLASALLIEKAGGKITTPTAASWDVFSPDILASNGILHERLVNLLNIKEESK